VIRARLVIAMLLALSACVPTAIGYRDANTQISSTTRFDAARFAGAWQMRAALGAAPMALRFAHEGGVITALQLGDAGSAMALDQTFPARFNSADGPIWLLWVDDDYRTAVLGAPDGRFAWLLDRNSAGGADRIAAARSVLEFNGYDLTQLREVTR